jgi:hypothetical protein
MIDTAPLLTQIRRQSMRDAEQQGLVGAARHWQKTLEDSWRPNPRAKKPGSLRDHFEVAEIAALVVEDLESTGCHRCSVNWDKAISLGEIQMDETGTYHYGRTRAAHRPAPDHWVKGVFVGPPKKKAIRGRSPPKSKKKSTRTRR